MNRRRQALKLGRDTAVIVIAKVFQIQQLALQKTEEVFHHGIVKAVTLSAHALPDSVIFKQLPALLVLVLPRGAEPTVPAVPCP